MSTTRTIALAGATFVFSMALLGGLAKPADAVFHFANIQEILTSYDGDADVQFVEIIMNFGGQNLVADSKLSTFDADGSFLGVVLTVDADVASGAERRWIMGTQAFVTAAGLSVDFVFTPGLPTGSGMVCWGKPFDETDPDDYVDCVSYGAYTGPPNDHTAAPNPISPDGHTLQRVATTHDSSVDFECADPGDPENNAFESVELVATVPCQLATTTTTSTTSTSSTSMPSSDMCGDANGDGDISATDALLTLRAAVGSAGCALAVCDADGSGTVTASDALIVLKAAVGQPVELVC